MRRPHTRARNAEMVLPFSANSFLNSRVVIAAGGRSLPSRLQQQDFAIVTRCRCEHTLLTMSGGGSVVSQFCEAGHARSLCMHKQRGRKQFPCEASRCNLHSRLLSCCVSRRAALQRRVCRPRCDVEVSRPVRDVLDCKAPPRGRHTIVPRVGVNCMRVDCHPLHTDDLELFFPAKQDRNCGPG